MKMDWFPVMVLIVSELQLVEQDQVEWKESQVLHPGSQGTWQLVPSGI